MPGQWSLPPSAFKMLIDTGADHTSVDASVIAPWGLHAGTAFKSQTMGGIVAARAYDVALSIRDSKGNLVIQFDPLPVVARRNSPFDGLPFLGLLGRDVLDRGVFFYNGKGTYCTLAF